MKTSIKNFIKHHWSISPMLLTAFTLIAGCITTRHHPDPLAAWHFSSLVNLQNNKAISDDYHAYIKELSPQEKKYVGSIEYFEDETGQHAVRITIGVNGTVWRHILIYDKDNRRIKTIKYASGGYQS